jgi:hypothetical protein
MMVGSPWLLVEGSVEGGGQLGGGYTRQGSLYTLMLEVLRIKSGGKRKAPGIERSAGNEGIY